MQDKKSIKLAYLLLTPFNRSDFGGVETDFKKVKNSPYFFDTDIHVQSLYQGTKEIEGREVSLKYYVYDGKVFVAECIYDLQDDLNEETVKIKEKINKKLRLLALAESGYKEEFVEEYSVVILQGLEKPQEFISSNQQLLAGIIRSVDKKLAAKEIKDILVSRVSYSQHEATVVDWEGAVVISDEDFESDLELFKVGNYQLLRYRMLDGEIDQRLKKIRKKLLDTKGKLIIEKDNSLKDIVGSQLNLLIDFTKVDQSLLLVGDWYSAKLYKIIVDEFYIDEWKALVKEKLDSLVTIDETVRQKLIFSWDRLLDMVSIVGWLLLLIGYFYLYLKDVGFALGQ